ncbi:hypothetical protein BC1002_0135 [Paraburkholderia atlantica]|uniref:Uncharacterized protein n=1 Tax=Paraburkholderia atlantica TaxID=2654982 RepID=D5WA21_PARAM|nr:hypothetical protein [Paraburkholderia atlantica]ADG14243.1 hypothetical protein BC1002_0135 [Paraburkholderia atlantica]
MTKVTKLMIFEELLKTRALLLTPYGRDFLEDPYRACIKRRELEQEVLPRLRTVQAARQVEREP